MDATVVYIDQTKQSVAVEPRDAWFPRGSRPSVALSGQREWTCSLGAITDDGERFFSRFTEYVTAEHAKHLMFIVYKEFRDDLLVVLDGALYFQASAVQKLAERDDFEFLTLLSYSPELNPVEECWRQLETVISNRYYDSLPEFTSAIDDALDRLSVPKVSNHF